MAKEQELLGIEYAAIAHLLLERLQTAATLASQTLEMPAELKNELNLAAIPLRSVNAGMNIFYVSAIALKLANVWNKPTIDIANAIAAHLLSNESSKNTILQNFTFKVVPPGWIHLQLSDPGMAAWLQCLVGAGVQVCRCAEENANLYSSSSPLASLASPAPPTPPTPPAPSTLFKVQYAHARCCSLLRLAHRDGIIQLAEIDLEVRPWFRAIAPVAIPWLDSDLKLRLVHSAERNLIFHLLTFLDDLYCVSRSRYQVNWEKSAISLSQAFLTFYSQCRIWGEVKTENPQLAQARLGLILATQPLLQFLLEDFLGVPAPQEL